MSKLVVAFGGNALGNTPEEQLERIEKAVVPIADLIEQGHQVVLTHGNGPQVGLISNAFSAANRCGEIPCSMPFPECGAMSQGYIGYHIQNALEHELRRRGIEKGVVSLVTQMLVDRNDPAFSNPTKYVGAFMSEDEAKKLSEERGLTVKEDSGRGWRQVVPSPPPIYVIEGDAVKTLFDAGYVVIAAGGGGIPVALEDGRYVGTPAVIDKDFAAAKLASLIGAHKLVILTAVDRVCIDFNKPTQRALEGMTVEDAHRYIREGQFAPGSMLPKVLAALSFVEAGGEAIIASLENAPLALKGESGTIIRNKSRNINMDINYFKNKLEEDIIGLMLDFRKEFAQYDYSERSVNECRYLIENYLDSLAALKSPSDEEIMALVKDLVFSLNELNHATLGTLIETDAREDICELIRESAVACGLQNAGEDITEEWRMW